jgi:hypothetical protein
MARITWNLVRIIVNHEILDMIGLKIVFKNLIIDLWVGRVFRNKALIPDYSISYLSSAF